ncbi:hypothetical protein K503DRAFT_271173 [Rhizopogon vinicolor AM-OR11-026]|uniref:Uncharacterized protein n=1 Tax=Rhizopogon vinicolor AM-OR11-026 TaxID=1314800 RepID=A0A1B7MW74_9AGAM|nr:hypothetical protein K503DRAFT_271173 [Rhizopogon vinicolor AM-OR11-026]
MNKVVPVDKADSSLPAMLPLSCSAIVIGSMAVNATVREFSSPPSLVFWHFNGDCSEGEEQIRKSHLYQHRVLSAPRVICAERRRIYAEWYYTIRILLTPTTILGTCSASCSHACCKPTDQTTLALPMAQK